MREEIEVVLENVIAPLLAADGASVSLVEVQDGRVRIRFGGSYRGCPSASYALEGVVAPTIRKLVDENLSFELVT